jgi:hypothetical protein
MPLLNQTCPFSDHLAVPEHCLRRPLAFTLDLETE